MLFSLVFEDGLRCEKYFLREVYALYRNISKKARGPANKRAGNCVFEATLRFIYTGVIIMHPCGVEDSGASYKVTELAHAKSQ